MLIFLILPKRFLGILLFYLIQEKLASFHKKEDGYEHQEPIKTSIKQPALRDGDFYTINGSKTFITNGVYSSL